MNMFELASMVVVGMGLVAGVSLAIYSALPSAILNLTASHGRYSGLGTVDESIDVTSGTRPVAHVGSLQGHSA